MQIRDVKAVSAIVRDFASRREWSRALDERFDSIKASNYEEPGKETALGRTRAARYTIEALIRQGELVPVDAARPDGRLRWRRFESHAIGAAIERCLEPLAGISSFMDTTVLEGPDYLERKRTGRLVFRRRSGQPDSYRPGPATACTNDEHQDRQRQEGAEVLTEGLTSNVTAPGWSEQPAPLPLRASEVGNSNIDIRAPLTISVSDSVSEEHKKAKEDMAVILEALQRLQEACDTLSQRQVTMSTRMNERFDEMEERLDLVAETLSAQSSLFRSPMN